MGKIQAIMDYLSFKENPKGPMRLRHPYKIPIHVTEKEIKKFGPPVNLNGSLSSAPFTRLGFYSSECCSDADLYHSLILDSKSEYYRRGYILVKDNVPLGHVKFKGDRTFLSWQTIETHGLYPLLFGGIYEVRDELVNILKDKNALEPGLWGFYEVGSLELNPRRFIEENRAFLIKGSSIREMIRREKGLVKRMISEKDNGYLK
jgi:hypothetical protein